MAPQSYEVTASVTAATPKIPDVRAVCCDVTTVHPPRVSFLRLNPLAAIFLPPPSLNGPSVSITSHPWLDPDISQFDDWDFFGIWSLGFGASGFLRRLCHGLARDMSRVRPSKKPVFIDLAPCHGSGP